MSLVKEATRIISRAEQLRRLQMKQKKETQEPIRVMSSYLGTLVPGGYQTSQPWMK